MKHLSVKSSSEILHRIELIEKEVSDLKMTLLKVISTSDKKIISLKGIIKGFDITNQDITSAKKSLYSNVKI